MHRRTAILAVLTVLVATFYGCQRSTNTPEKPIRFGSFSVAVDYAPYLVAKNKGWFEDALRDHGFKPEYTLFQSLPPINESLATKRVDIVFEAEPPAIVARAAGIDLNIVALSCSLVQEIVVPMNSEVQSTADLKGKRIAVLAGTGSHYGLLKILRQDGVLPHQVQIIDMTPPDAKNAFGTRQVDAWAVWPPWVEQEEIAGTGRTLGRSDAYIQSMMVVRSDFARENAEAVRAVVTTVERAKAWIQQNPSEAQEIVSRELNVPLEVVRKAWPRHDWAATLTEAVIVDIEQKAQFLHEQNFIRAPVDVRAMIDTTFGG